MSLSSASNKPNAYEPCNNDTTFVNASSVESPWFEKYSTNWTITSVSVSEMNDTPCKYSPFNSS